MNAPTNLEAVRAALDSERFLDMPVEEYRPKLIGSVLELGTASTFRGHYANNLTQEQGVVTIGKHSISTAPEVTAALRALLCTGCCHIEARSAACREIFFRIVKSGTVVTKESALCTFEECPINPFVRVLQDTIKELFT